MSSLNDATTFPAIWDNTMLADASDCEQKVNIRFFHHLRPSTSNVNLHAGGAFAKGIEALRLHHYTSAPGDAVVAGARALITHYGDFDSGSSVKSCDRMLGALQSYVTQYNPDTDHLKPHIVNGRPCVEFSFAHPLDIHHPTTGEPIIYCGRFDMLGVLNGDEKNLFVVDEKTTTQLGPTWVKQWQLRSQFMGYVWGARKFGYPVTGAIVRGVSILKNSYGHAEAIVYFPEWMLERWYQQVHSKLARLIAAWQTGDWHYNFSSACSSYGGCAYRMLCESEQPDIWLSPYYEVAPWDPMKLKEGGE